MKHFSMKPFHLIRLLWVYTIAVSLNLFASDVKYLEPIGTVHVTFENGTRFTGIPLVNSAVARGTVTSISTSTLTVGSPANVGGLLSPNRAYYVEFVDGPTATYVGDRFDIDVTATRANANNTLVVATTPRNTLASLPPTVALAGYSFVVRAHVTIGQIFGIKDHEIMHGSTSPTTADRLQFFNPSSQAWETYFFLKNSSGSIVQWTKTGGGSTNRDNEIIAPGAGFSVVRNATSPVTIHIAGKARTNGFAQPLVAGNNLIAQPWPIAASPLQRQMTTANGMTGSTSPTTADKILKNNSDVFATYYLLRNSLGSIEQWTLSGGGSTDRSNDLLFGETSSVIISKIYDDMNYLVPYIYP